MSTVYLDDAISRYSDSLDSHKSAWPRLIKCQLNSIHDDVKFAVATTKQPRPEGAPWYLVQPMATRAGAFNLQGGVNELVVQKLKSFIQNRPIRSIEHDCPDLGELVRKRRDKEPMLQLIDDLELSGRCSHVVTDQLHDFISEPSHTVIGDSHTLSVWKPGDVLQRTDGRTLFGQLKRGFGNVKSNELTVQLGNIDIRFHVCRQHDMFIAVDELLKEMERQLQVLHLAAVELVWPYPIEHEERKLPGTGLYKGAQFFGTRQQRKDVVEHWRMRQETLAARNDGWTVWRWPEAWYEMDGEEYARQCMERPRSVHLSSRWYRWDLERDEPNKAYA